jgi:C-terminal processing protease CtpA/Prc
MTGMRVRGIVAGTPADQSGLRQGDIITHVGSRQIHDADGLVLAVGRLDAGKTVHISVKRLQSDGTYDTLSIASRLTKFPVRGKKIYRRGPGWRGMHVDHCTVLLDTVAVSLRNVGSCVV